MPPIFSGRFFEGGFSVPFAQGDILSGVQGCPYNKIIEKLINLLGTLLLRVKLIQNTWELREKLGLPPASPMDAVRRKYGVDGLREAYKENLCIVLGYAAQLCWEIMTISNGKIVITADHGELLGEHGKYSHGSGDQLLTEVPWFEVRNIKKITPTAVENTESSTLPVDSVEKEKIRDRIRRIKESGKLQKSL